MFLGAFLGKEAKLAAKNKEIRRGKAARVKVLQYLGWYNQARIVDRAIDKLVASGDLGKSATRSRPRSGRTTSHVS